jgi:hypothetical protein
MRCGIDDFALLYALDDIRRTMSHPAVRHRDERFIVCLQNQTDIQRGRTIMANALPVAGALEDYTR